ncbi:MAG: sulfate ABC transporter substrate-binding protein [Chloroflexi bacterium]|nr:sulfate ABC transporter substrate-binding protein [Chloroflexota bacterium]MCI0575604.1 sulfate ABC transporter substrate-binding protein [Chloroflexota bacterium]MCI0645059.1 sulfate ABC transporter substrate-binding protein [Chloroflexota bacterium]MCI0731895.1 sulfate ABC transporter substrate-binding protein [Chloroflexota bacterium]
MKQPLVRFRTILVLLSGLLAACGPASTSPGGADDNGQTPAETDNTSNTAADQSGETVTLILGAYTTPREAYGQIIPLFQAQWKEESGQNVVFEESYLGSGAQSRAIVEGFEADIAALSLEADINRIADAGLITHDWKNNAYKGMVSTSVVAFAVRNGNPLEIHDWADLAEPGVEVLTPNPKSSGGAQWNILALYGAAQRGFVEGVPADDDEAAQQFLLAVLNNVTVMDKAARESITNFEAGVGDVAITYENEVLVGQQSGQDYELAIPRSSILIENPVAVIDTYVDEHGTREVAEAFVEFLYTKEAQEIFAEFGLRAVDPEVAEATADRYPVLEDLFTIEQFGGWQEATPAFFGDNGIYTLTVANVARLAEQE